MIYSSFICLAATAIFYSYAFPAQDDYCGLNASKYLCAYECEDRCNAVALPRFCQNVTCAPPFYCGCYVGFARESESNQCVRKEECPVNVCGNGETKRACGRTCEGTCSSPFEPKICQSIFCATQECRCDLAGGFVRNEKTGQCVRLEDC